MKTAEESSGKPGDGEQLVTLLILVLLTFIRKSHKESMPC